MTGHINIAIDGPAGAGKSTIAKLAAKKLGFIYIDTGAMYRALAVYFLENKINIEDEASVEEAVKNASVNIEYKGGEQRVLLNGRDVSDVLRREEVGAAASKISAYGAVRDRLLSLQRGLAEQADVIMDGRDIGTKILPHADLKIYLDASSEERARRRVNELKEKGFENVDFAQIKRDIEERDYRDMHREVAPLKRADDAFLIDSTKMSIEEVGAEIARLLKEKTKGAGGINNPENDPERA